MSVLGELASAKGARNDVPNQDLARKLAAGKDDEGVAEIVEGLAHPDPAIQSDCIKVLYEIGYINPGLIAPHTAAFIGLLRSRNNRLVWGGMIALSTVAQLNAREIFAHRDLVTSAMDNGSVITVDAGIKTLAGVAAADPAFGEVLFPQLLEWLRSCRPKSVAQYAESILVAATDWNKADFVDAVEARRDILTPSQSRRVEKLLRKLG